MASELKFALVYDDIRKRVFVEIHEEAFVGIIEKVLQDGGTVKDALLLIKSELEKLARRK